MCLHLMLKARILDIARKFRGRPNRQFLRHAESAMWYYPNGVT